MASCRIFYRLAIKAILAERLKGYSPFSDSIRRGGFVPINTPKFRIVSRAWSSGHRLDVVRMMRTNWQSCGMRRQSGCNQVRRPRSAKR
jgi:hypothetical protein